MTLSNPSPDTGAGTPLTECGRCGDLTLHGGLSRPATDPAGLDVRVIDAVIATIRRDDLCDDTDGEHHTDEYVTAFLLSLDAEYHARLSVADGPGPTDD